MQPLLDREVPRLLAHPDAIRVSGHTRQPNPPRPVLDEKQHIQRPQPRRLHREEIARQHPLRLGTQELAPRRAAPTRGRTETGTPQNRPDRGRAHPDAELAQLTLDPHTPPARVLPPETNHQCANRRIERRPTRPAAPVTPLPPHQLTMPAKQRLRRNQQHRPAIPRQQPARSGKQQPVTPPQRRPLRRPPKHGQLVPEHRVLQLQRGDRRAPHADAKQPPHRQEHEEQKHQSILRIAQPAVLIRVSAPYRHR